MRCLRAVLGAIDCWKIDRDESCAPLITGASGRHCDLAVNDDVGGQLSSYGY